MPVTVTEFECDRCGRFQIPHALANSWRQERERRNGRLRPEAEEEALLPYLSAHTRQAGDTATLDSGNWQLLARLHVGVPVSKKRDRLMELIASRSTSPGAWVSLLPRVTTHLLDMHDDQELEFIVASLRERVSTAP